MAKLEAQLNEQGHCPHCGISHPLLLQVWHSKAVTHRNDGQLKQVWAAYQCSSCGGVCTASGTPGINNPDVQLFEVFPEAWSPEDCIPDGARKYLEQAKLTLSSPDASVVMSAAAIDSMLKSRGLIDGSLFSRIDLAVTQGLLTQGMADWAHLVRLNSNNPRHADVGHPHISFEEAKMSLDFAKAIAEVLYVLPSRIPTR